MGTKRKTTTEISLRGQSDERFNRVYDLFAGTVILCIKFVQELRGRDITFKTIQLLRDLTALPREYLRAILNRPLVVNENIEADTALKRQEASLKRQEAARLRRRTKSEQVRLLNRHIVSDEAVLETHITRIDEILTSLRIDEVLVEVDLKGNYTIRLSRSEPDNSREIDF